MRGWMIALLAAALTACGTTEPPPAAPGAAAVTVTDSRGEGIRLPGPATRVVALEWAETEMLVSLGVMPVGVADLAGYTTWDKAGPLDPSVKDVGTRQEPSVDAIAGLDPDVIIVAAGRDAALPQLTRIAPVMVTKATDATRNLDRLREDLTMIARAVGRTDEADRLLSEMDQALADGRGAVTARGAVPVFLADGHKKGSTVTIRPFGKGSLVSDVAEAVGLTNAWTGPVDPKWGLGQTDVEGLSALTDPATIMIYSASEDDVFTGALADNPLWRRLPFVQTGRVTRLEAGTWTFGGPKSVISLSRQITAAATR